MTTNSTAKCRSNPELTVNVTAHAIDRMSQRHLSRWQKSRSRTGEGLHSWTHRLAIEAFASIAKNAEALDGLGSFDVVTLKYCGIRFKLKILSETSANLITVI